MSLDASVIPSKMHTELCTQFEHRFVPCVPAWLPHTKKLTHLVHFAVAHFQLVAACQMSLLYTAMYPRSSVKHVCLTLYDSAVLQIEIFQAYVYHMVQGTMAHCCPMLSSRRFMSASRYRYVP